MRLLPGVDNPAGEANFVIFVLSQPLTATNAGYSLQIEQKPLDLSTLHKKLYQSKWRAKSMTYQADGQGRLLPSLEPLAVSAEIYGLESQTTTP